MILVTFISCKHNKSSRVEESISEYTDTINTNIEINQSISIDTKFLDSLSKKVTLPYGRKELVEVDFPKEWYCGGGYLEHSLKKEGLNDKDSIQYAQSYFRIIKFNRNDNINIDLNTSIKLNDSGTLQTINNLLVNKNDDKQKRIKSESSLFIKLPNYKNFKIFGLLAKGDHVFYNPIYIIVKNNRISDVLAAYEYSKSETLVTKSIYIDENHIFNCKTFDNIDGYEVSSREIISYKISDEGKFVKTK
ncbi:hypothetical protein [Aquimarina sp. RZ0]|uniref:hypothetical protein n=1 Tax=Aquimarina sp. RZ0 TaxID=2607730 RepID=UPI0011F189C4|nr:hypothetical protein [Aquimarina sp. RZ0]KAA1241584.1 hypothetical protein F0000_26370 [Aquimarina sp. RZ0]